MEARRINSYLFVHQKPHFEAGKDWDYSDTNYIVLGMIIEKVTGKKYYDLAKKRILKPLKFKRTFPQDRRILKGLIQGYAGEGNEFTGQRQGFGKR
ncbi:MAG: beta-lactamase family protein [Blastocatellia bacterium]|nr:beta-lactamase family protein [Blastocatellia bacterium]